MSPKSPIHRRAARAFTLIELIATITLLGILGGIALKRSYDYAQRSRESADAGALTGINQALRAAYFAHITDGQGAPITTLAQVAATLQYDELPKGWRIDGATVTDQRGTEYQLVPETDSTPARLAVYVAPPPPPPPAPGPGGGAPIDGLILLVVAAPWLRRPTRRATRR